MESRLREAVWGVVEKEPEIYGLIRCINQA